MSRQCLLLVSRSRRNPNLARKFSHGDSYCGSPLYGCAFGGRIRARPLDRAAWCNCLLASHIDCDGCCAGNPMMDVGCGVKDSSIGAPRFAKGKLMQSNFLWYAFALSLVLFPSQLFAQSKKPYGIPSAVSGLARTAPCGSDLVIYRSGPVGTYKTRNARHRHGS
jgi:hypothetical protein